VILPQATKIAIPNIGSMFIGMVKDTSVFTIIGVLEIVRVTQNLNSLYFQPFVFYSAAAVIYVVIAFVLDFLFRGIERVLATPPKGRLAGLVTRGRRRRVEAIVQRVEAVSAR
jgi:ABC-type amino acid transport system permease subunit